MGFPLGVYGFSDVDRSFTPTFLSVGPVEDTYQYENVFEGIAATGYEPEYVLGDGDAGLSKATRNVFGGATRLMCFPHVDRRVAKHILKVPAPLRDRIRSDINDLCYAINEQQFLRRMLMPSTELTVIINV